MTHDSGMPTPDILLQHGEFIRRLARGLVGSQADAEDLAQDVSVAALDAPEDVVQPRAWLRRVARNLSLTGYRRDARRRARELVAARRGAAPSAADDAARMELQRRLVEEVYRLDEPLRAVVVARFFDGMPPRDVARKCGIPVETVRTRTRRALAQLRGQLDRQHKGDRRAWFGAVAVLAFGAPSHAGALAAVAVVTAIALVSVGVVMGRGEEAPPARRTAVRAADEPTLDPVAMSGASDGTDSSSVQGPAISWSGSLLGPASKGIADARVRLVKWDRSPRDDVAWFALEPPTGFRDVASLPQGTGPIPFPAPGHWIAELSGPGYLTRYMHMQVTSMGGSMACGMCAPIRRALRVVDEDGQPIASARMLVGLRNPDEWPRDVATSDDGGWIQWDGYVGESGWVLAPGYRWRTAKDEVLVLDREHRLAGVVHDESGRVLAGAVVRLEGRTLPRTQVTALDGRFRFVGLPDQYRRLHVSAEGYVDRDWSPYGTNESLVLRMERGVSFSGRITLKDGSPAANAALEFRREKARGEARRGATDADGRFSFSGVSPGSWSMEVAHGSIDLPGGRSLPRRDQSCRVELKVGEDRANFELQLEEEEISYVPLLIVDDDGEPVLGAKVRGGIDSPLSDRSGRALAVLRAPSGTTSTLRAQLGRAGPRGSLAAITRADATAEAARLVIHEGRRVMIIARRSDGTPLPAGVLASVHLSPSDSLPRGARKDRAEFICWPRTGDPHLSVRVAGFGAVSHRRWKLPDQDEVEIRMPPVRRLVADFVTASGAAASRAEAEAVGWYGDHRKERLGLASTDGRLDCFIPAGVDLLIHVERGAFRWVGRIAAGTPGEPVDLGRVVLDAPRTCEGVVVDPSGAAVKNAKVYALSPGGMMFWSWCSVRTDADGQFRMRLPEGVDLRVYAAASGAKSRPIPVGPDPVRLVVAQSAGIKISFRPGGESTLIRKTVVRDRASGSRMVATISNGQGHGLVMGLAPGEYVVEVSGDGWSESRDVDLSAGETRSIQLEVPGR